MSYIGKNVAPQPQGTYSQSEIDTQMLTKSNSTDMTTAIALKANLASPALTGTPTAPTASTGTNTTQIATTEFVNSEISNDVGVANSSLVKTALNASGSAPIYACRAWVNFNGAGTVAIRASGNVSSITDNGTGNYTVNFTTAMPDENFVTAGSCHEGLNDYYDNSYFITRYNYTTTSGVSIRTAFNNGVFYNCYTSVAIFR